MLFDEKFYKPDFRAVELRTVTEQDKFEKGFVGLQVDFVVKLRDKGAQFFEEAEADLFEVAFGFTGRLVARIFGIDVRDIVIETNGTGLCRNLPFGGTEENGDVMRVNFGDARRDGGGFERVVNGGEENGIASNMNDGAAAGEVGDDFVFLCVKWESEEKKQPELEKEESQRVLTISYLIDLRREEGSGGGFREALVPVDFK